jgi:CheY-like chemotaxis protein
MGKRILVADDSQTIQKAFAMVLGGEHSLIAARSLDEALSAAKTGRPDLVIADAALGTSSGYDLCAALKADASLRVVPVHILTSNQSPYDEGRGRRVGADGHMLKPFESQALIDSVAAALAAPVRAAAPAPAPAARPAPAPAEPAGRMTEPAPAADDDSYGEFTIERSSAAPGPSAWMARPPTKSSGARPLPSPPSPAPVVNRPSLIPGARPPGSTPVPRQQAPAPPSFATPVVPTVPRPMANRTIMGFPSMPGGASPGAPVVPAPRPAAVPRPTPPPPTAAAVPRPTPPAPTAAAPGRFPAAASPRSPTAEPQRASEPVPAASAPAPRRPSAPMATVGAPAVAAAVSSAVDGKLAAIAARGPEYAAIATLSREIIEQVVWEVVPELAEVIIKQEVDRLAAAKR